MEADSRRRMPKKYDTEGGWCTWRRCRESSGSADKGYRLHTVEREGEEKEELKYNSIRRISENGNVL